MGGETAALGPHEVELGFQGICALDRGRVHAENGGLVTLLTFFFA